MFTEQLQLLLNISMDSSDLRYAELGLDFYQQLNHLDDAYLEDHNYSREEVQQGLQYLSKTFGIPLPN